MFCNRFTPLLLLEDTENSPDMQSLQHQIGQTQCSKVSVTSVASKVSVASEVDIVSRRHLHRNNSTILSKEPEITTLTSPRSPLIYPDRIPKPFASEIDAMKYYEILQQLPNSPKYNIYRSCFPVRGTKDVAIIESYAIVLVSFARGDDDPTILLGHRRESIEMSNLVRGLYDINELYIILSLISPDERRRLREYTFEALWQDYWPLNSHLYHMSKAKQIARAAYDRIKPWLVELLTIIPQSSIDTEWLFPRGRGSRKHVTMKGETIAIREFEEETELSLKEAKHVPIESYRELYFGSNGSTYATTHYVYMTEFEQLPAKRQAKTALRPWMVSNDFDSVAWLTMQQIRQKLNPHRVEMVEAFVKETLLYRHKAETTSLSRTDSTSSNIASIPATPEARSRSSSHVEPLTPPNPNPTFRLRD